MGANTLIIWSTVALVLRVLALTAFVYVLTLQFEQIKYKSNLQGLKWLLFYSVVFIAGSNIPIMWLHVERILGHPPNNFVTSFATVTNAGSMLVVAVLLLLVYRFRVDGE